MKAELSGETNRTLTLSNAQPAQAGSYQARVRNTAGEVFSQAATLTVLQPPGIAQQPASSTNAVGSSRTLLVVATGTAPLTFQWYFNGTNLPSGTADR